jgi:hypothetical protein
LRFLKEIFDCIDYQTRLHRLRKDNTGTNSIKNQNIRCPPPLKSVQSRRMGKETRGFFLRF